MNDALDMVWQRAELPDHVISAAEIARWRPDERDAILKLGLLRRTEDTTALICEDCGSPHSVEVIRDPRKPRQPYYLCPEIGRVPLAPSDLQRWETDFGQIAAVVRQAASLTSKPATVVPNRIWLLGRQRTEDGYWELFLMRGLCWPEGNQLFDQCSRLQQSPSPVVLVPYRLPPVKGALKAWPIRTLSETVSLDGSSLVVDLATLETAALAVETSAARAGKRAPWKRMSRSIGTPEAVASVSQYLQDTQMTHTQFGNQFQSTDKTVRKFLNLGKLRRSIFEAMAESMGLTSEELLGGKLSPSMKRPAGR